MQYLVRKLRKVAGWLKNRFLEGKIYAKSISQISKKKRIIFLPSDRYGGGGGSSDLRAYRIAERLQELEWECYLIPARLELKQRTRIIRLLQADLLFVQQGTHQLNCVEMLPDIPYLFDIDDAYYLKPEFNSKFINLCRNARGIICSSREISKWCKQYNSNISIVWTGAPIPPKAKLPAKNLRLPIICWPHHFIEGINEEERAAIFEIMCEVRKSVPFTLRFIGVQNIDGFLLAKNLFAQVGITSEQFGFLNYSEYTLKISECTLGIDIISDQSEYNKAKSFGKALAYLQTGVPMVVSAKGEYPYFVRNGINGFLAANKDDWIEAIVSLLTNSQLSRDIAKNAFLDFKRELSTESAAEKIAAFLRVMR